MKEQGLHNLLLLMNQHPCSSILVNQYQVLKKHINDSKITDIKEKLFKENAVYLMHGDKPTKAFFDKYKNKSKQNYIKSLKNEKGEVKEDISGMLKIAERFYTNLCSGNSSTIQQSVIDFFLKRRPVCEDAEGDISEHLIH